MRQGEVSVFDCDHQPRGSQPGADRARYGETREEWLAKAKNVLRLLEHTADHETGISRAITKQNADELRESIQAEEMAGRFQDWCVPEIKHGVPTKYGWIVSHPEGLILGRGADIGAFCYLQAESGIEIGMGVQLGGGCKIYSVSTIDNKRGAVLLGDNCKIGANSVILPGTVVGERAVIGALSFVQANAHIPPDEIWAGVPAKKIKRAGR